MTKEQFADKLRKVRKCFDEIENVKNDIFEAFFDTPENEEKWDGLSDMIDNLRCDIYDSIPTTVGEILIKYNDLPFSD